MLNLLLMIGMIKKKTTLVRSGSKIIVPRWPYSLHKSSGLKMSTVLSKNYLQALNQPWKNATSSSKQESIDSSLRSPNHLKSSNVWKSSTSSQSMSTPETSYKTSSAWGSTKLSPSLGYLSWNSNGLLIRTMMFLQDNSVDSLGNPAIKNSKPS